MPIQQVTLFSWKDCEERSMGDTVNLDLYHFDLLWRSAPTAPGTTNGIGY